MRRYSACVNSHLEISGEHLSLDPKSCRRARLSRDPRFDGEFFLGVRTTGVYCRPVCPARPAAERNVQYFREAAQAAAAGFRPCLRCRPESAPGSPAWRGSSVTVQRALQLITQGALNREGTMAALADRLGVGERYLRKLFRRELGVSPRAVAQNRRLLFAKQLLRETALPLTDIAFAAGFGSVRRFNSAVRDSFACTPGELRRGGQPTGAGNEIRLRLSYRAPYDWEGVHNFFARHALAGVESVGPQYYRRNLRVGGAAGWFELRPLAGHDALELRLQLASLESLMALVCRIRRMFDLDANPAVIAATLKQEPALGSLLARYPGIRSPLCWSPAEAAVRAIIGQQVSIGAARTVCARLAAAASTDPSTPCFPEPGAIAALGDEHFAMPSRRRDTLRAVCAALAQDPEAALDQLGGFPGIGTWTTAMVAMRGQGHSDVFPHRDLGLLRAWRSLPGAGEDLHSAARRWRPWRSYAANLMWRSLSP